VAQSANKGSAVADHVVHKAERHFGNDDVPMSRGRLGRFDLIRIVIHASSAHHLSALAGNLAYNAFLALVPFVLVLVVALRALHATDVLSALLDLLSAPLPSSTGDLLRSQLQAEVTSRLPPQWLLGGLLGVGALWASSAGFRAVGAAMNVMYETPDDRPLFIQIASSLILSLLSAALLLAAFALAQIAGHMLSLLPNAPDQQIWTVVEWVVLMACAFVAFAATYAFVPQVKRSVRAIAPGAAFATLAIAVFSLGFAWVINVFGPVLVDPLYGWFTGVFALLMYLYWASFILLLGGEVNNAIETNGRGAK
jgi:membrane protein